MSGTSQHNSVTQRMNRMLIERVESMHIQLGLPIGLPKKFWVEKLTQHLT